MSIDLPFKYSHLTIFIENFPSFTFYSFKGAGIWQTIQDRYKQRGKEIVSDIIDGKYYKRLCEAGQFLSNPSNISFIFNTDGAPLYSSSSVSLWPVFLAINELPSPDRYEININVRYTVYIRSTITHNQTYYVILSMFTDLN